MDLGAAVVNLADKLRGGVADLRRMPRDVVSEDDTGVGAVLYRYRPDAAAPGVGGAPVLLVPPLGAPDFAYDLRRGCSLVEHLLGEGRTVYLVDYGAIRFAERGRGMEHWVDTVVPWAVRGAVAHAGTRDLHLLGWSLGGIFSMLAVAAAAAGNTECRAGEARIGTAGDAGRRVESPAPLPVASLTVIGSPVDIAAVPLIAPLRPLAAATGGRGLSILYQAIGSFPAPLVSAAFQLTAVDKLVTKPLTLLSRLDDRDCLAQIEAVDYMMNHMHGYPGRVFGQLYHLLLRNNDLSDGTLALAGRSIPLGAIDVPVLVVAGRTDVIAPLAAVRKVVELLTGAPEVRFETAPGGHLGVLTGRLARGTTWFHLDAFLTDHSH